MAKYIVTDNNLTSIANAIRTKGDTSESLAFPSGFISAIDAIQVGGGIGIEYKIIDGTISSSYKNNRVLNIRSRAFYRRIITLASFLKATIINEGAFYSCYNLTTIYFPKATTIGNSAFCSCYNLTTASFPEATTISSGAFSNCTGLTTISFPKVTTIANNVFRSCYNFISLYLLGSSVATLNGANTFTSTPITGYTTSTGGIYGSVFVPESLLTQYQSATNWALISARIVGLTSSQIEELQG